ncbi:transposase [Microvirga roseola]|uniref:transposase n=1 Tax=Microvirga roseola TaxID=2883126 RepID=UPI001E2DFAE0|nr:transposase [Microvirga roseola]
MRRALRSHPLRTPSESVAALGQRDPAAPVRSRHHRSNPDCGESALYRGGQPQARKIFGTWKRSYGLRRMRWTGLARAALQVRLTAMVYNLKRTAVILMPMTA